jgi:hypothetical protein
MCIPLIAVLAAATVASVGVGIYQSNQTKQAQKHAVATAKHQAEAAKTATDAETKTTRDKLYADMRSAGGGATGGGVGVGASPLGSRSFFSRI